MIHKKDSGTDHLFAEERCSRDVNKALVINKALSAGEENTA